MRYIKNKLLLTNTILFIIFHRNYCLPVISRLHFLFRVLFERLNGALINGSSDIAVLSPDVSLGMPKKKNSYSTEQKKNGLQKPCKYFTISV